MRAILTVHVGVLAVFEPGVDLGSHIINGSTPSLDKSTEQTHVMRGQHKELRKRMKPKENGRIDLLARVHALHQAVVGDHDAIAIFENVCYKEQRRPGVNRQCQLIFCDL